MTEAAKGERIAKRLARAGVCSRREAEAMIEAGRVAVDGVRLATPAVLVTDASVITVDGAVVGAPERTRVWRYHKPRGVLTTARDPQGRPTVFDALPKDMPRVIAVGRLDFNSEGLLLLTNDGGLSRRLELPETGWLRRYRVRAFGRIGPAEIAKLARGMIVDGVRYGVIEAQIDREQGDNVWLTLGLREGKNREIRKVLEALGLRVNRLIRVAYGPFQLGRLEPGEAEEVPGRVLAEQLGQGTAPKLKPKALRDGAPKKMRGDGAPQKARGTGPRGAKPRQPGARAKPRGDADRRR